MPDSPNNEQAAQTAAETPPAQEASNQTVASSNFLSPWLWMVAGLIAAVLVPVSLQAVAQARIPMPADYAELSGNPDPSDEDAERMTTMENTNRLANHNRFMMGPGVVMSLVFGLFAGLISRRIVMGIVGAVVGAAIAYALPMVASEHVLTLQQTAIENTRGGDTTAMTAHGLQWVVFGACAAVAVLIGYGKVSMGGKAFVAMLLAAALGAVLYVILGAILDATNQTGTAEPVAGTARYLWTSVPPLLAGFFLARMGQA